ncbi:hypothetical protein LTR10_007698 [Elasticomyces elasticus]|nr:hypothetical protein LTR10_007698 [Elasticomyces elasticus]KAK4970698.1 hypothetical protein LTR42_007674 [Elasticomyces elasticus]
MASTESVPAPAPTSGLIALAPELRNRIWTDVFTDPPVIVEGHCHMNDGGTYAYRGGSNTPGILLVSRQVHNETIGLYYSCSIFQPGGSGDPGWVVAWLKSIPSKYVALVTDVRLDTNACFPPITTNQDTVVGAGGSILLTDLGGDYTYAKRVEAAKLDIARVRSDHALSDRLHLLQEDALKASVLMPDSSVKWMSFPPA